MTPSQEGYARPGQHVTVAWAGADHEITADSEGFWVFVAEDTTGEGNALPMMILARSHR